MMGRCIVQYLGVTPEQTRQLFSTLLTEYLGGSECVEVAVRYHDERVGMRTLATEHGMSLRNVHTVVHRTRRKLRAVGLMPEAWESRCQSTADANREHD